MKIMAEDEALTPALQGFLAKWHPECMAPRMLQEALRGRFSPGRILCLGKAAPGLARAAAGLWPGVPGLAYGTSQDGAMPSSFEWLAGDHPFPTPRNLEATGAVERWVAQGDGAHAGLRLGRRVRPSRTPEAALDPGHEGGGDENSVAEGRAHP